MRSTSVCAGLHQQRGRGGGDDVAIVACALADSDMTGQDQLGAGDLFSFAHEEISHWRSGKTPNAADLMTGLQGKRARSLNERSLVASAADGQTAVHLKLPGGFVADALQVAFERLVIRQLRFAESSESEI